MAKETWLRAGINCYVDGKYYKASEYVEQPVSSTPVQIDGFDVSTVQGLHDYMNQSKTMDFSDWNRRCDAVKAVFNGYPKHWHEAVIEPALFLRVSGKSKVEHLEEVKRSQFIDAPMWLSDSHISADNKARKIMEECLETRVTRLKILETNFQYGIFQQPIPKLTKEQLDNFQKFVNQLVAESEKK